MNECLVGPEARLRRILRDATKRVSTIQPDRGRQPSGHAQSLRKELRLVLVKRTKVTDLEIRRHRSLAPQEVMALQHHSHVGDVLLHRQVYVTIGAEDAHAKVV
jgi:hypothetical protein